MDISLLTLGMVSAFVFGYAAKQGTTCAVTAAKEVLRDRNFTLWIGFAMAAGCAIMVALPLHFWLGQDFVLAPALRISFSLVGGSILIALGAVLNDACLFGTLYRPGSGQSRFIAIVPGLAAGFWAAGRFGLMPSVAAGKSPLSSASPQALLIMFLATVIGVALLGRLVRPLMDNSTRLIWSRRTSMLVLGASGALLFGLEPGWSYADTIHDAVATQTMTQAMVLTWLVPLSTVVGAVSAGNVAGTFNLQLPTWRGLSASFLGGALMGFGASMIPGGNDSLLLWSIPSLSWAALLAYTVMAMVVFAILTLAPAFAGQRRGQGTTTDDCSR